MKTPFIILIAIVLTPVISFVQPPNLSAAGKLTGRITRHEAVSSTTLPDAGSEIMAVRITDREYQKAGDMGGVIEYFNMGKSVLSYEMNSSVDPVKLKKARVYFDTVSQFASRKIRAFRQSPSLATTRTDGSGRYSLSLEPGRYFILIVSGNIRGNNPAEINGVFTGTAVEIKPSGQTLLDHNFTEDRMMWIRFISTIPQQGC